MVRRSPVVVSRRAFLSSAGLAGAAFAVPAAAAGAQEVPLDRPAGDPARVAADETYWRRVAAQYRVSGDVTNLEAGFWGVMATPVAAAFARHVERVNRENSFYARRSFDTDLAGARARVAALMGVTPEEIALTRNATEALQCLIAGYNRLKPGDAVLYADVDYPAMQHAMNWLVERRGVTVVRIALPEPASRGNVLAAYAKALEANPAVRLVLLTHLNNKTGLVIPTAEITALARARGADTITDAAHSIGQMDVTAADIGSDFIGFNLHKWIGAPIGAGAMYIRRARLSDIDRMMADESAPAGSILSRVHTGTMNFATVLTIPAAIDFHAAVGAAHKAARLRYLRDRWVAAVRPVPGIQVLTPDEPGMAAAITSFRLHGRPTREANDAVVDTLLARHNIFTCRRSGLAHGDCVRVTPSLYNTLEDVDRLATALTQMV
jgi:isopenicillin-N epimerase